MGDDRYLLRPEIRNLDKADLDNAMMKLKAARQPLLDQMKQTGEAPSWLNEATTGIPAKLNLWFQSGAMAPTAPNGERSYFREQADKEYEAEKQRILKSLSGKQSPWEQVK